jgi:excinuclease UvrABC nuclease subunit
MKTSDLTPPVDATVEFDLSKNKKIPSQTGCYIISNFEQEILYIGKAINLRSRFLQHLDSPEKTNQTPLGKPYWFSYALRNDEFEISKLERGWLNHFELQLGGLPILNKIHAG